MAEDWRTPAIDELCEALLALRTTDEAAAFADAVIGDGGAATVALPPPIGVCGRVEIVLADGLQVIVEQDVDPGALALLIGALERR